MYHIKKRALALAAAVLLLALRELEAPCTRRDLADFTGLTRGSLSFSLQRLTSKELILLENLKDIETEEKLLWVSFPTTSEAVFQDLDVALEDARQASQAGLTQDERTQYETLSARIQSNIRNILQ